MSKIIGNATNIQIARILGVLRVSHLGDEVCYDGEDYVNDLNAMHEVEKFLDSNEYSSYCRNVHAIVVEKLGYGWSDHDLSATASERAEAFIKTIG